MEVKAKQHERPEEHGQDERQQFANASEYVSVSVSYHRTDNEIKETHKRTTEHVSSLAVLDFSWAIILDT
jgi:hypothetical protein